MNLDESRDERGGQKGNVWTRAGAREMRERFRSVIHTSLFSFCLSPFEGLDSFSPCFMSGWDEKHNHQHFHEPRAATEPFFCGQSFGSLAFVIVLVVVFSAIGSVSDRSSGLLGFLFCL
jgi:hypothetical protein